MSQCQPQTFLNFLHLLNKHLFSIYCVLCTLTGTGNNKMGKVSAFMDLRKGDKTISRQVNNKIIASNKI